MFLPFNWLASQSETFKRRVPPNRMFMVVCVFSWSPVIGDHGKLFLLEFKRERLIFAVFLADFGLEHIDKALRHSVDNADESGGRLCEQTE